MYINFGSTVLEPCRAPKLHGTRTDCLILFGRLPATPISMICAFPTVLVFFPFGVGYLNIAGVITAPIMIYCIIYYSSYFIMMTMSYCGACTARSDCK